MIIFSSPIYDDFGFRHDYFDHSDYNDSHYDHSDYNDAAERKKAEEKQRRMREEEEKRRREEARRELDDTIRRSVESFENSTGVCPKKIVTSQECSFENFQSDMEPMDSSAKKAVNEEIAVELSRNIEDEKKKIEEIDKLIVQINSKMLNDKNG